MRIHEITYSNYLAQVYHVSELKMHKDGDKLIRRFQCRQAAKAPFAPVLYILDYCTRKYIYVDEGCFDMFGYTASHWKEVGIDWYLSKWHPADYNIMNDKIFPKNLEFIASVPPEKFVDFIFSHNYRTLNARGEYITILQRSSFIPSNVNGAPKGAIGIAIE